MDGFSSEQNKPNVEKLIAEKNEADVALKDFQQQLREQESFSQESVITLGTSYLNLELNSLALDARVQNALGQKVKAGLLRRQIANRMHIADDVREESYGSLVHYLDHQASNQRHLAKTAENKEPFEVLANRFHTMVSLLPKAKPLF